MPSGVYKRTKKHGMKISFALKGKVPKNIKLFQEKGRLAVLGSSMSAECKKKISCSHKRSGVGKWMKGRHWSEETRNKFIHARRGDKHHYWGKSRSEDTKNKISQALKGQNVGENNPAWQGGKTAVSDAIRASTVYKQLRTRVRERDNYTCQECGQRGGVLHVNHKIPFSEILRRHAISSMAEALACIDLWDEDNLETLCLSCHKKTPSYPLNLSIKKVVINKIT